MIVQVTKEAVNLYRKKYLCPICKTVIKRETWDGERCFGEGSILSDDTVPRYCPNCGTSLSGKCLFEPIHGRYPDCERLGLECEKCIYWQPEKYKDKDNDSK